MPETPEPLGDPDEDLIAYLDGELDEPRAQVIESNLARNASERTRAESLKKTYDLLDHLPKPEPSAEFASKTLTHIGVPVRPTESTPSLQIQPQVPISLSLSRVSPAQTSRPVLKMILWVSAAFAMLGLGYAGHLIARPHLTKTAPTKRTSEQVRLLERLLLYIGVDTIDFARQLDTPDLFGESESPIEAKPGTVARTADSVTTTELEHLENLFKHYPAPRQEQLRQLDDDIQNLAAPARDRMLHVLERYAIWLDRLPDTSRKEVLTAPSVEDRLEAVRRVRQRQWRESLPKALRDKLTNSENDERDRLLEQRRLVESERRHLWNTARKSWADLEQDHRPWPFNDPTMEKNVKTLFDAVYRPRLKGFELQEYEAAQKELTGNAGWYEWFNYGYFVARMTEAHPALPRAEDGKLVILNFEDLSARENSLMVALRKNYTGRTPNGAKNPKIDFMREFQKNPTVGLYPEYAEFILNEAKRAGIPVKSPLGPCKPDQYVPEVRTFLAETLQPQLTESERTTLQKLEGQWPEHPRKLMELAQKHDLPVPTVSLPGSPSRWQSIYFEFRRPKK